MNTRLNLEFTDQLSIPDAERLLDATCSALAAMSSNDSEKSPIST